MREDLVRSRVYCCFKCRNIVALHDDILKKTYRDGHGRAFLFSHAMNIFEGPKADQQLNSGVHMVSNAYCSDCGQLLGRKYHKAYEERHMHKVGKIVLTKYKIAKAVDPPTYL
ncbi:hypothetical protein RJ639_029836 [Escallonia herrerae]|uniref:Protein yippee-like n=1 Tax=Escallonia herrerae TaxID=1293975 RepID=A0AA88X342_9ASTE|nr:hypothetical protein RJ639_029836 [Escallonia herrerae]